MQPCAVDGQNSHRNAHHVTQITDASGATKSVQQVKERDWHGQGGTYFKNFINRF